MQHFATLLLSFLQTSCCPYSPSFLTVIISFVHSLYMYGGVNACNSAHVLTEMLPIMPVPLTTYWPPILPSGVCKLKGEKHDAMHGNGVQVYLCTYRYY